MYSCTFIACSVQILCYPLEKNEIHLKSHHIDNVDLSVKNDSLGCSRNVSAQRNPCRTTHARINVTTMALFWWLLKRSTASGDEIGPKGGPCQPRCPKQIPGHFNPGVIFAFAVCDIANLRCDPNVILASCVALPSCFIQGERPSVCSVSLPHTSLKWIPLIKRFTIWDASNIIPCISGASLWFDDLSILWIFRNCRTALKPFFIVS